MQGTGNQEPKKAKKLVLSSHNRAALTNERSNFITETKTVVVHKTQPVVLDSPERASRNRGGVTTAGGLSLASIGIRHMQKQKERQAMTSHPIQPVNPSERKSSQFLSTNTSSSSSTITKSFGIGALGATSFSAGGSSKNTSMNSSQTRVPLVPTGAATASGGLSLSDKFRARQQQKQQQSVTASASADSSASSLSQLQRSLISNVSTGGDTAQSTIANSTGPETNANNVSRVAHTMQPANGTAASNAQTTNTNSASYSAEAAAVASSRPTSSTIHYKDTDSAATSNTSTTNTTSTTSITSNSGSAVQGGLFLGTGRTMAVKR